MRIFLDNQPCPVDATSLGEAILVVNDLAEENGRLVVEVHVDGSLLSEQELQEETRLESTPERVELKTTTALALLSETFASAAEAILEAEAVQTNAAKLLQGGTLLEGMKHLSIALGTWMEVHEAVVKGLLLAGEDPDSLQIDNVRLIDASSSLQARLSDLRAAITDQDSSAICDCLLYEFPEVSEAWGTLLRGLAQRYHVDSKDS